MQRFVRRFAAMIESYPGSATYKEAAHPLRHGWDGPLHMMLKQTIRTGMSAPSGISRECMSDRVCRILLERILEGTYPPGHRLVELQLARELNTSQGPVREALRELEAVHLVQTEPYRGTYVRAVSERELREAYQVRAVLEELAGQLATPALQAHSDELQGAVEAMRTAAARGDRETYTRHNFEFHRAIVAASGNEVLLRQWELLALKVRSRVVLSLEVIDLPAFVPLHQRIVEAIRAGDAAAVGRLLREHSESLIPTLTEKPARE